MLTTSNQAGGSEAPQGSLADSSKFGVTTRPLAETPPLPPGLQGKGPGLPDIPGYTILEEIGRGGMGVVYKARQVGLNRIVAIKTILDGVPGVPEARARFRTEAAAVAQLQHPHIVQIYEIGEHQGRVYFSLEYVAGGNLDQRMSGPSLAFEEAAALVEALARGVQHAHQRGIVHRDLKPANILLASGACERPGGAVQTEPGRSHAPLADCVPKITDFGLAKQLEGDGQQTRTGSLLGTPAYMAPEQAAGRTRDIGPATDIHALGVILYELLTGRRPFLGGSVTELLEAVRYTEAVPPSRLRPNLPRDLDTICLKALAKEPAARYSSALALAQDLERFRNGESILARRERIVGKLWRMVRRNPAPTAAVLAIALAIGVAGYVAPAALRDRQIVRLVTQINDAIRQDDWSPNHVQRLDELIAELGPLSPDEASQADQRLRKQWSDWVGQQIDQSNDREQTARLLEELATHDPDAARMLRKEYDKRTRLWRPLSGLTPPFNELTKVSDPAMVHLIEGKMIEGKIDSNHAEARTPSRDQGVALLASAKFRGNIQLEAEFGPSWAAASRLGLLLNVQGNKGYSFVLRAAGQPAKEPTDTPASLADARKAGQEVRLQILRDGMLLREERIKATALTEGPLRLQAKQVGDRLTFQVNDLIPLEFRESFPLASTQTSKFGAHWNMPGVPLGRLRTEGQDLPLLQNPLEQGDEWFVQGDFRRALEFYRQVALRPREASVRQESRYKEGLCLMQLNRPAEEIIPIFQELAGGDSSGDNLWSLRADCQLLLIRFDRHEDAQADAILNKFESQGITDVKKLLVVVPEEARLKLERHWSFDRGGQAFRNPADAVRDVKRLIQMKNLFDFAPPEQVASQLDLIRAYRLGGFDTEALAVMEKLFQSAGPSVGLLEEYCWLLRSTGKPERAGQLVDEAMANPKRFGDGGKEHVRNLLVERARIRATRQDWSGAAEDIQEFLCWQETQPQPSYGHFAAACLMEGFLLERQKKSAGEVEQAWRRALPQAWLKRFPDSGLFFTEAQGGTISLQIAILGSLTNQLSDADAKQLVGALTGIVAGDSRIHKVADLIRPSVLREMWRTPRGRDWARRIAFRDLSFAQYFQAPLFLAGTEMLRQVALPQSPRDDDQEEVLWQLAEQAYAAYLSGKLKDGEVLRLAVIFHGTWTSGAGWQGLTDPLDPRLRGPMAYVFGHRYLRGQKRPEAERFFRAALADAKKSVDARLERLAQRELERLKP